MGILIFAISLLPALGIRGQRMAKAETPGPTLNKLVPRMSDSAKILYFIYIIFTIVAFLLFVAKVNTFDAIILAFSSVASGGLTNYNNGIAHFNSLYIESILFIFTLLVCVNFTLYYNIIRGNLRDFFPIVN
jgi:trk system potassium uptake protein TrkH